METYIRFPEEIQAMQVTKINIDKVYEGIGKWVKNQTDLKKALLQSMQILSYMKIGNYVVIRKNKLEYVPKENFNYEIKQG